MIDRRCENYKAHWLTRFAQKLWPLGKTVTLPEIDIAFTAGTLKYMIMRMRILEEKLENKKMADQLQVREWYDWLENPSWEHSSGTWTEYVHPLIQQNWFLFSPTEKIIIYAEADLKMREKYK